MSSSSRKTKDGFFWEYAERFPPVLCRLLAKSGHFKASSNAELAKRSGLTEFEIEVLSRSTSWRGIDVYTMRKFTQGCGLDFASGKAMKRANVYLRSKWFNGQRKPARWLYLKKSPEWKTVFEPLMKIYIQHLSRKTNN